MERTIISGMITEITMGVTKTNKDYIMGALTWDIKDHRTGHPTPVTKYFFAFDYCKDAMLTANLEVGDIINLEGNYSIIKNVDNFGNQSISAVNFNAYKMDVIMRWNRLGFYQQLKRNKEQAAIAGQQQVQQQQQLQPQTIQQQTQEEEDKPWELDL